MVRQSRKSSTTGPIKAAAATLFSITAFGAMGAAGDPLAPPFVVGASGGNPIYSNNAVATNANGNAVVVWLGSDGLYGRRYGANGLPLDDGFLIDALPFASGQQCPDVAMDQAGDFVVTWYKYDLRASDQPTTGVFARRYTADGVAAGDRFMVSPPGPLINSGSAVATDQAGDFVIAWSDIVDFDKTTEHDDVFVQRYSTVGEPIGGAIAVAAVANPNKFQKAGNSGTVSTEKLNPSIDTAMDSDGDFAVTWAQSKINSTNLYFPLCNSVYFQCYGALGRSETRIYARRYNAAGVAVSAEPVLVNASTSLVTARHSTDASAPSITIDDSGNLVVAWAEATGYGRYARNQGNGEVMAQRVSAANRLQGSPILVAMTSPTSFGASAVSVAASPSGSFVVTWENPGPDSLTVPYENGIFARRYAASGQPLGDEAIIINPQEATYSPHISVDALGDYILTWSGLTPVSPQTGSIFGQSFQGP